ncbi:MAG: DUF4153 domain-containing protein [Bacteroidia bacterium]|nr:DUF4153 domain-containing protein [Bacteroidia bacterium]
MLKFISIKFIVTEFLKVFHRFSVTVLCSLIAASTAHASMWEAGDANQIWYSKIILTSYIGLCFSLAIYLFFESKTESKLNTILKHVLAVLVPVLFYLSIYNTANIWTENIIQRNFVLLLVGHLTVAFSAYLQRGNLSSFWEFNKSLFLRFITASVYTIVVFLGIFGALLACKELFGLDVNDKVYGTIFFWCNIFFQSCIFLAGITNKENLYADQIDYPNPLKIFAQYILLPIAAIYLGILYAYEIKILIAFTLPKGWVSSLILAYAVLGLFCFLLLHPIKDNDENKWVKSTLKYFYWSIIPLLVLLFVSVFVRINQYGITTERYYILGLSLWLAGITFYGVISKNLNIKLIPISLAIVHLLMVIGPVNGFMVSRISQQNRLEILLLKNNLFDGTKIIANPKPINKNDAEQIRSIVSYLVKSNNINDVSPLCGIDLIAIETELKKDSNYNSQFQQYKIADSVFRILNILEELDNSVLTYINASVEDIYETNGAKYMLKRYNYPYNSEKIFEFNNEKLVSYHTEKIDTLWIQYQNKKYLADMIKAKNDMIAKKKSEPNNGSIDFKQFIIPLANGDGKIEVRLQSVGINSKNELENIEYYILVK